VNVNEQRIIAFLTEKCCYLNLQSKVRRSGSAIAPQRVRLPPNAF